MQTYIREKIKWTSLTHKMINWTERSHEVGKRTHWENIQLHKLIYNWDPLNDRHTIIYYRSTNPNCPNCPGDPETIHHLLTFHHWNKNIDWLSIHTKLRRLNLLPTLIDFLFE